MIRLIATIVCLVLCGLGCPLSVQAQARQNELLELSLEELMEVKVTTASLNGATLANSAAWLSVITESDWRQQGARRPFDALVTQPATLVIPHVAGGDMVVVRGYTRTASNRGIALILDDVPMTDFAHGNPVGQLSGFNLFTLNSMDMVQGSGSALYGNDAFHGVVGMHSYDGGQGRDEVALLAGSDRYYEGGVRGSVALGEHHRASLALASNGQGNQQQGYQFENPLNGEIIDDERAQRYDAGTAVFHLTSDPSLATTYQASLYRHRYEAVGFNGVALEPAPDEADQTSDLTMGQFRLAHQLGEQRSLSLQTYYWDLRYDRVFQLALGGGSLLAAQDQTSDQHRYGLQLTYRDFIAALATRWALAIGHEDLKIDDARSRLISQSGALLSSGEDSYAGADRAIDSLMFEADSDLADGNWQLVWGARLDDYSDFGQQVSPRAGLIFHPSQAHSIKLIYSEAFRAPSAEEMKGNGTLLIGNPDLEPETNRSTELIWMYQDANTVSQVGLFNGRWDNGIVTRTQVPSGARYENQERNSNYGIEASLRRRWQTWQLDLSGAWVESRNDTLDEEYGAFPRYALNLGVGYSAADLRTDFYLLQRVMLQWDGEAAGGNSNGGNALPHYWRTDFTATWHAAPALDVELVLQNVFDRDNQVAAIIQPDGLEDEPFSLALGARYLFQ